MRVGALPRAQRGKPEQVFRKGSCFSEESEPPSDSAGSHYGLVFCGNHEKARALSHATKQYRHVTPFASKRDASSTRNSKMHQHDNMTLASSEAFNNMMTSENDVIETEECSIRIRHSMLGIGISVPRVVFVVVVSLRKWFQIVQLVEIHFVEHNAHDLVAGNTKMH
jgi:hypothetical protein